MDKNRLAILKLIKAGLLSEQCVLEDDLDWNYILLSSYRLDIVNVVYQAIKSSNIHVPPEYLKVFQVQALHGMKRDRNQISLINALFKCFEENGITYLPLKGSVFKSLYPKSEFRQMGDADIYIKAGEYDRIKPLMELLGYSFVGGIHHELIWERKDELIVELHKSIFDPTYGMIDYFDRCRDKAVDNRHQNFRMDLDINDHLVYAVIHLAKHCIIGSASIKNLLDIYFLKREQNIDETYVEQCLKKLQLKDFYDVLCAALDEWFNGKDFSERSEKLLIPMLTVSEKNKASRRLASSVVINHFCKKKVTFMGKVKFCFMKFFRPYKHISKEYPVLKMVPVLLPVFWFWRPFHHFFTNSTYKNNVLDMSGQQFGQRVEKYKADMELLGLEKMIPGYDEKSE